MLLALAAPTMLNAQFSGGNGSQGNPYQIANIDDWNTFASNVNSGTSYSGEYFILTGDISTVDANHMVGTINSSNAPEYCFSGTFDGKGHTVNINVEDQKRFAAPFRCVNNATIKNLHTAGTIDGENGLFSETDGKLLAGVVGASKGTTTITGCSSNATITTTHGPDAALAGIVAAYYEGALTVEGCVFTGVLHDNTGCSGDHRCGGLVGWQYGGNCTVKNSLFAPTSLGLDNNENDKSRPIIRIKDDGNTPTIQNCYYTTNLGGTNNNTNKVYTINGGENVTVAMNGTASFSYEYIDFYFYNNQISFGTGSSIKIYAPNSSSASLLLSYTGNQVLGRYNASNGTLSSGTTTGANDAYTLTMPNTNVTISATTYIADIASITDWNTFCSTVNGGYDYSGKTVTLSQNISGVDGDHMVGDESHPFSGIFDGQGHTIDVSISSSEQGAAPFHYISGATIKDLVVTGTVTATAHHAAGLVGFADNNSPTYYNAPLDINVTITNCLVHTNVDGGSNYIGGIIGHNKCVNTTIEGCVYDGTLTSSGYKGGMIGWSDRSTLTVRNTYFGGSYSTSSNFSPIGCKTQTQNDEDVTLVLTFSNFYYNQDAGSFGNNVYNALYNASPNGTAKHAYTITGGSNVTVANAGTANTYSVSGITSYSTSGIKYNNVLYAGQSDNVSLNLSCANAGSGTVTYNATYGTSSTATLTGSTNPYTLSMPAGNTTINFSSASYTKTIAAYGNSERDNYYLIASPLATAVDPATVGMITDNDAAGYTYNLYYFDQNGRDNGVLNEWRNYNVASFNIESGKGYLYASKNGTTITFTGAPYSGNGQVTLSKTANVRFSGWNLVGNPFTQNAYIADRQFYIINPEGRSEIIAATVNSAIEPMEGIFVIANSDEESLTFSTTEPVSNNQVQTLNVSLTKADIKTNTLIDRAIVRFDEASLLPKFQLNPNHTKIYIPQNGTDYAVVYTQAEGELPLNLKVEENGRYTLSVDIEKVSFDYLHLIDNMTGDDVDLLATPSYTFNARKTDYASRFKLVFDATGIEENGASTGSATFAYNNGSEWVIDGASTGSATCILQVIDMMGRVLSSESINGTTTKAINAAQGIYMLRLVNGDSVKVQKIVVR